MKLHLITAVIVTVLVVSGCFKEEWEGFVYPNKHDLSEHINIGTYKSLEECRAAAIKSINKLDLVSEGDYECGLNCESKSGMDGIKVCEKTEQ